jgi:hypothetical protein
MTGNSPPNKPDVDLSEEEKARIRAEVGYAIAVTQLTRPPEQSKTTLEKIVSNSAFYLIVGSLLTALTSIVTLSFSQKMQQNAENEKQQIELSRQLFQNFVLYSNTLWKELYAVEIPTREKLSQEQFFALKKKIHDIQLGRRDAYAKILVIANTIGDDSSQAMPKYLPSTQKQETTPGQESKKFKCILDSENNKASNLQTAIENYSRKLETKSQCITRWLDALYCKEREDGGNNCSAKETMTNPDSAYNEMVDSFKSVDKEDTDSVLSMIGRKNNAKN